ncbi:M23 family metallopeptidase, partial [Candidatus Saccharibacteria bacterium]|nr:M23 family metallopeptidase [Candidatus Saccharibacteria bacterium]
CYQSQTNCHHDYNAADIFAPTGTTVVAARGGTVVTARDNDGSSVGSRVTIKGTDGNLYYYTHMGNGTIRVGAGDIITAGQEIGKVGTRADAVGTDMHLHFDALPPPATSRPGCSGASCRSYPFINVQPVLTQSFNALPD